MLLLLLLPHVCPSHLSNYLLFQIQLLLLKMLFSFSCYFSFCFHAFLSFDSTLMKLGLPSTAGSYYYYRFHQRDDSNNNIRMIMKNDVIHILKTSNLIARRVFLRFYHSDASKLYKYSLSARDWTLFRSVSLENSRTFENYLKLQPGRRKRRTSQRIRNFSRVNTRCINRIMHNVFTRRNKWKCCTHMFV